jgi:hypothetical protein
MGKKRRRGDESQKRTLVASFIQVVQSKSLEVVLFISWLNLAPFRLSVSFHPMAEGSEGQASHTSHESVWHYSGGERQAGNMQRRILSQECKRRERAIVGVQYRMPLVYKHISSRTVLSLKFGGVSQTHVGA